MAAAVIGVGAVTGALNSIWEFSDKILGFDPDNQDSQPATLPNIPSPPPTPSDQPFPTPDGYIGQRTEEISSDRPTRDDAPKPESGTTVETSAAADAGKEFVRESSATEVVAVMNQVSMFQRDERFEELFEGRWIKAPGWVGEVLSEPDRNDFGDWNWSVGVVEEDSRTLIVVFTEENLADLRKGDKVRVTGQLRDYLVNSPSVHNAVVERILDSE